jgi:SnoaL-like domain
MILHNTIVGLAAGVGLLVVVRLDAQMPDPETRKSMMLPQKPEDWPGLFVQYLNSGDLEAVGALYAPNARFVARSGETIIGRDRIRDMLTQ